MAELTHPLTDEDLAAIKEQMALLDHAQTIIDQAMRAGIDVKDQQDRARELRDKLTRLKQSFFPGR